MAHRNPWDEPLPENTQTFLVVVPDKEDSKRFDVRQAHIADAKVAQQHGWIMTGGPIFTDKSDPSKMTGSWMLARAVDEDDLKRRMTDDIYHVGGAWDMSKVTVTRVAASV